MKYSETGNLPIVELLLTKGGADHSLQNKVMRALTSMLMMFSYAPQDGDTALHLACRCGHLKVAEFLLRQGADYTRPNKVFCPNSYMLRFIC